MQTTKTTTTLHCLCSVLTTLSVEIHANGFCLVLWRREEGCVVGRLIDEDILGVLQRTLEFAIVPSSVSC